MDRHVDCRYVTNGAAYCGISGQPLNNAALFRLPLPRVADHDHSILCVRWSGADAVCAATGMPLNFEGDIDPDMVEDAA